MLPTTPAAALATVARRFWATGRTLPETAHNDAVTEYARIVELAGPAVVNYEPPDGDVGVLEEVPTDASAPAVDVEQPAAEATST